MSARLIAALFAAAAAAIMELPLLGCRYQYLATITSLEEPLRRLPL